MSASPIPLPKTRPASNELITEDHAALEFARLHAGELRFCHDAGAWFEWSGSIWKQNRTGLAFQFARELARDLSAREPDKVRYVSSKTSFAAGVERFARSDPAFAVTSEAWDKDGMLLGTPGGTVDLRTGRLRPSDPGDNITKSTTATPADRADCPRWIAFLHEATGNDDELIRFLQQWCGYSITGSIREHALVFLHGGGGEGKSTFLNTVSDILGSYATTAPMDTFTASRSDKHPTDLAMLRGARLVTASETEEGRSWAEARIKQMTGGDPISARFMRQDFFTFAPQFKLTIVGNHRPTLHNVDDAARRRFNIVPFTRKPARPDPDLPAKLRAEAPAILRWMIGGCLDWQSAGLIRPAVVKKETDEYFAEQDTFSQWLADECTLSTHIADPFNRDITKTGDLLAAWKIYAANANERAGDSKSFACRLQKLGVEKIRTGHGGVRAFRGIRLIAWNGDG
ncbi:hypothetical+protein [Methylocapsa aurea]|uniref:phage/plasmid primase, P4 family n=1 Tax=Methylocapsa aurea TaxID=663610 RepID=UPI003D18A213